MEDILDGKSQITGNRRRLTSRTFTIFRFSKTWTHTFTQGSGKLKVTFKVNARATIRFKMKLGTVLGCAISGECIREMSLGMGVVFELSISCFAYLDEIFRSLWFIFCKSNCSSYCYGILVQKFF